MTDPDGNPSCITKVIIFFFLYFKLVNVSSYILLTKTTCTVRLKGKHGRPSSEILLF